MTEMPSRGNEQNAVSTEMRFDLEDETCGVVGVVAADGADVGEQVAP